MLFVLHFVLVYCSLVTFSFSIFSAYRHTVLMAFIVYSNWILFWQTFSVCWRDANILILPRHQRLSIDLICMYIYIYIYICEILLATRAHRQKTIIQYNKIYVLMIRDKHTPDLGYA